MLMSLLPRSGGEQDSERVKGPKSHDGKLATFLYGGAIYSKDLYIT